MCLFPHCTCRLLGILQDYDQVAVADVASVVEEDDEDSTMEVAMDTTEAVVMVTRIVLPREGTHTSFNVYARKLLSALIRIELD